MFLIKNIIFVTSLLGSVLAFLLFESHSINICDIYCDQSLNYYHRSFIFFYFLFFFSLLTYKLPETISRTWMKYAIFATPVVLVISLYINLELHHDPKGAWQGIFDSTALWILYILFSLGSLISIIIGWRKNKR
jgi:hypothetical protein